MKLYRTNRLDDPGEEHDLTELAAEFWQSDHAAALLDPYGQGNLSRAAMEWVAQTYGSWADGPDFDAARARWDQIEDAIFAARPWRSDR
jgi:hypothetical protein